RRARLVARAEPRADPNAPAGGALVGGGWGQALPDDGPSPDGPPRPEAEGCSPSAGSPVPREVGGVTLSRDESDAPAGSKLHRDTPCPPRPRARDARSRRFSGRD